MKKEKDGKTNCGLFFGGWGELLMLSYPLLTLKDVETHSGYIASFKMV